MLASCRTAIGLHAAVVAVLEVEVIEVEAAPGAFVRVGGNDDDSARSAALEQILQQFRE